MQLPFVGKVQQPATWLIGLVTVGILGTATASYLVIRDRTTPPNLAAITVPVESQQLTVRITASGTVQPIQTVNLSPKNAGVLQKLYVKQGDRVTQGQVIAQMKSDDVQAELTQSRARVAQAQSRLAALQAGNRPQQISQGQATVSQSAAQMAQAEARLKLAEDRAERNRALAADGAISQDSLDAVLNEAELARANLAQLQAAMRQSQENLNLLQSGTRKEDVQAAAAQLQEAIGNQQAVEVRLEDTVIRAPFNGIVTQKYATEGAFVTPTTSASEASSATSTAIVAIAQGLEVLAEVPEVDIQQLKIGQSVEVVADAYPDRTFKGKVRLIAPEAVVKQNVTSFQVRVDLETGQDQLLSGMNVDLTFLGDRLDNALAVPTVAIVTVQGKAGVLIPGENGKAVFRPITPGAAVGNQTQVLDGLRSGERIFTDLPPGQKWQDIDPSKREQ
jgi:HlyD family secretion protein